MPKRIQRKRTKGWKKPEGAVYVGRGSKWGNPWQIIQGDERIGRRLIVGNPDSLVPYSAHYDRQEAHRRAVQHYEEHVVPAIDRAALRANLAGKDLMCWCPADLPCHADVLLTIANEEVAG